MGLWARVLSVLERPKVVKWVVLYWMFIFSWFDCVKEYHDINYGINVRGQKQGATEPPVGSKRVLPVEEKPKTTCKQLEWTGFPKLPPFWRFFQVSAYTWMVYVIIRFNFKSQIGLLVNSLVKLPLPIDCYLVGRFVLDESFADITEVCVSGLSLAWMLAQVLGKPFRMDVVYFLLQSEHDLELIYSRFKSGKLAYRPSLELNHRMGYQLDRAELFLLDTLCYRGTALERPLIRLRANRTRDAHTRLRRLVSKIAAINSLLFLIVIIGMTIILSTLHLLDSRYLRIYPNCSPELERLNSLGLLSTWSMTLTGHHMLTVIMDFVENSEVYVTIGSLAFFAPNLILLATFDLVICWQDIDAKIRQLESEARRLHLVGVSPMLPPVKGNLNRANRLRLAEERELVANINDFMQQVACVNKFLSRMLDCATIGILGLCATYSYQLQTTTKHALPWPLLLLMSTAGMTLLIGSYGFLLVHRTCMRSYTRLCSLIAFDLLKCETKLVATIEYFNKRRECFTIMDQYPLRPTTFLTLIGWTFSCFCIISEVMGRNRFGSLLKRT